MRVGWVGLGAMGAPMAAWLDALARSAPLVGSSPGDGQRMKLVNQLLCGVHIAAAAEALAFAESLDERDYSFLPARGLAQLVTWAGTVMCGSRSGAASGTPGIAPDSGSTPAQ